MKVRRGRPPKPNEEKVLNNGLFPRQWERVKAEAKAHGFADAAPFLRQIVDEYLASLDAERDEAMEHENA